MIATIKNLKDGNKLCIIDIEHIDDDLKKLIDDKFVKICEGNATVTLPMVKKRLVEYLTTKKGENLEVGSIAEFFIHLYLNTNGYEPQFLFFNLEENSIKKGFDGYYFLNDEEWIVESKSGSITTKGISHGKKIKESYTDLKSKLAGEGKNNPWLEAYNHASHIDVGADGNVRNNIKKFSDEYRANTYHKIDDFNIIPSSTIFLDGNWKSTDPDALLAEIETAVAGFSFKKLQLICLTKKSIDMFWTYLKAA